MNKIIIAFTSGIVLGLLYAPAKGKDTRRKISKLGSNCKDGWNSVTDKIAGKINSIKEKVDDIAYDAVEKIEGIQFDTDKRSF